MRIIPLSKGNSFGGNASTSPEAVPAADLERFNGCTRKLRFRSRSEAKKAGKRFVSRHGGKMHAYQCPHCQSWHLSSKKRW